MSIRDTLNEKPKLAAGLVGGFLVLAIVIMYFALGGPSNPGTASAKAFFSDDDGKTWFVDEWSKVPPFDHGGKEAVRAVVCQCGSGKAFVARLEKFPEAVKQQMDAAAGQSSQSSMLMSLYSQLQVKRPGDPAWVSTADNPAEYQKIQVPVCPDGQSGDVKTLSPGDPAAKP